MLSLVAVGGANVAVGPLPLLLPTIGIFPSCRLPVKELRRRFAPHRCSFCASHGGWLKATVASTVSWREEFGKITKNNKHQRLLEYIQIVAAGTKRKECKAGGSSEQEKAPWKS